MAPSADQEFVARQIVGSREEPTTILPVNGHIIIKLSPNDLSLYRLYRLTHLSTLTRKTVFSVDGD